MRLPFDGRFLILGVMVYIIVLVMNFPADQAYTHLKSYGNTSQFSLAGISGSAWSGQADLGFIQGISLENIEWSFRPWSLLMGKVALSWSFRLPKADGQGYGRGITSMGMDGSMDFSTLEAKMPAGITANMAGMSALKPSGTVSLNLQDVSWTGQGLVSATGRVNWQGAGVSLVKPVSLGDLSLSLETEGDIIKGVISDGGGPLSIAGVLNFHADGNYDVKGTLAARNDQDLENTLRSMGKPGPDGKVTFNYSGSLANLGLLPRR